MKLFAVVFSLHDISHSKYSTTLWDDCCVDSIANQTWNDALDEEDLDDVRSSSDAATDHCDINPELICNVQLLVGRLIENADLLLGKKTRNSKYNV